MTTTRLPEISRASEVRGMVDLYGFAIWRNILDEKALVRLKSVGLGLAPAVRDNGVVRFPGDLARSWAETEEISAALTAMVGPYALMDGEWESCYLYANSTYKPTVWHQECETIPEKTAVCWVALDDCGVDSPGLGLVLENLTSPHPILERDDASMTEVKDAALLDYGWNVVFPKLGAGDAVLFNRYSIHKTHITPEMHKTRIAYKLTARARE